MALSLKQLRGPRRLLEEGVTTRAFRCGIVTLKPKTSVGDHTTGPKEEVVVLLSGTARISLEGSPSLTLCAPSLAYIPPQTLHNVANCGRRLLRYVYIVHTP